jgi:hypothetical protein
MYGLSYLYYHYTTLLCYLSRRSYFMRRNKQRSKARKTEPHRFTR